VERRAGTSIFGHSANAGGGTVRVFCFWALFWCVCVIEQVGSRRDGTIEMVGGLYLKFHFLQFHVITLGERICAVGILCYAFCIISWRFLLVSYIQVVDC
jgi:hypothetical protein